MVRRRVRSRKEMRRIARERMDTLLNLAEDVFDKDRELSRRYVTLTRRIGMRYNVRLTQKDKLEICKRCNSFLVPGANCRVRTHAMRVVITCLECGLECGAVRRIPFVKERKDKLNKDLSKTHHKKVK
jgi:ribonuclease P protein subunit RPR2